MVSPENGRRIGPVAILTLALLSGCKADGRESGAAAPAQPSAAAAQISNDAPSPEKTGGFDGQKAYEHVAKQVAFGPRPSGSQAIGQTQDYILSQLKSFGCMVETDAFNANTPAGRVAMKNILVKIPGEKPGIILLATHYDTSRLDAQDRPLDNFVGADDGGSSTGLMLEMARLLCAQRGRYAVWIAFFDGEEAMQSWSDLDSRYGSREMAAKLAMSGDLRKIRAMLLADIVGSRNLRIPRESSSTKWLTDLVWGVAQRLGYMSSFLDQQSSAQDDHDSFLKRGVPAVDVISDFANNGYWHTPQDTMDKISARSLAIVGHVFVESVKELQAGRAVPVKTDH
jgi:glutaminyl-peptide cyclotransferase